MKKLCVIFLVLSSCVSPKIKPKPFLGEWSFMLNENGEVLACLKQDDVMKLREILIRCEDE